MTRDIQVAGGFSFSIGCYVENICGVTGKDTCMMLLSSYGSGWFAGFDRNVVARSVTVWVRCAVRRKVSRSFDASDGGLTSSWTFLAQVGLQIKHICEQWTLLRTKLHERLFAGMDSLDYVQ